MINYILESFGITNKIMPKMFVLEICKILGYILQYICFTVHIVLKYLYVEARRFHFKNK